jgi:hypothetical protein
VADVRDRGQAYTIQGVIGAILVASALVLGLQAVDISPWTEDGSEAQTEALRVQTQDLLAAASDRDALRTAATCIDGDGNGTPHPAVAAGTVANETERDALGTLLNRTLVAADANYRVSLEYNASAGGSVESTLLTPARSATRPSVSVTRQVVLFDSDRIHEFDENRGECVPVRIGNNTLGTRDADPDGSVYVTDQVPDSELYAVVKFRVVVW